VNNLMLILFIAWLSFLACVQKIDSNDNLNFLVEAERSFSKTSTEQGIRDAFLTFLADDAIVFRPQPVKAKPLYAQQQQIPGSLSWKPIHADMAASGDFGYTTGPFEYRKNPDSVKPDGCGFYVSVWKKQSDGAWRVMIDAGINCPCPETTIPEVLLNRQEHKRTPKIMLNANVETEKTKLLTYDFEFSRQVASEGMTNTYQVHSANDVRYYRMGELPVVGKENVCRKVNALSGTMFWKPMASDVAKSGDLGYTYGMADCTFASGNKKSNSYLRIWKKNSDRQWQVGLDLANPIPEKTTE